MLKYGAIIINEDEVIESIQSTSKNINEDDNFYSLLNKVLRKQIFIFERELLKAEECMSQKIQVRTFMSILKIFYAYK